MAKTDNHNKVYINAKGDPVMRVTDIIKVLAKDQLMTWANVLGFKHVDFRKELERTSKIGTMFHGFVEDYTHPKRLAVVDPDEYEVYGFQSQREANNAINSFLWWYDNLSVPYDVVFREKTVVGMNYGGTIDCGIRGFNDKEKLIFVDYKTSPAFYMTQFLQLCGYVRLFEEVEGPDTVEGIMVVIADKKNGLPARARLLEREELDMMLICFDCLYNTAVMTRMLNTSWQNLGRAIE